MAFTQKTYIAPWKQAILYLLSMTVTAISEKCPTSEEIAPCACIDILNTGEIFVQCADQEDEMRFDEIEIAFKSLLGKEKVKVALESINLSYLPPNFFEGIGITKLDIYSSILNSTADDKDEPILVGLENTLEEITIMTSLDDNGGRTTLQLGHLQKLRKLEVVSNTITELTNHWFDMEPVSLEQIFLFNNKIKKIEDGAFASVLNLKEFSVIFNRVGFITRSMFPNPANKLKLLNLNNNGLTSLPEDIFSNMPALEEVSINSNDIQNLEEHIWEPVWRQLKTVNLEGNPLICDSHMDWILNISVIPTIQGRCTATEENESTSLKDFIEERRGNQSIYVTSTVQDKFINVTSTVQDKFINVTRTLTVEVDVTKTSAEKSIEVTTPLSGNVDQSSSNTDSRTFSSSQLFFLVIIVIMML